jgi:histidinol dehydrogenase
MNVIRHTDKDFAARRRELTAPSSLFDATIERRAQEIIDAVREHQDKALVAFAQRFDGVKLTPRQFAVTPAELRAAASHATPALRQAIAKAQRNLLAFSKQSLRRGWLTRNAQGGQVGEKYDPFQRVGIYIPGGTAPLVSTALMTIVLATAAGCPEIVVCTPCGKTGKVNEALLHAADIAGATEIYRLGGAQAIAALAYGTPTIKRAQKIFGPGNAYVVAAKRLLFGQVAVDLLPGPSEVLILADRTANPVFIAADLLAQAEHGSGHERAWLATPEAGLIPRVEAEIERQLAGLQRREFIRKALDDNGWMVQTDSMESAIALANELAPEHCEIMTRQPDAVARKLHTAGAICLGHFTPNVLGDYVAGPSHVLPTGGAGVSFAGLTVDQFQRRTSIIQYDAKSLAKSLAVVRKFAEVEGLDAHGRSAAIRLEEA